MELYANPECIQFSIALNAYNRKNGGMVGWLSSPPGTTPLQLSLSKKVPNIQNSAVRI